MSQTIKITGLHEVVIALRDLGKKQSKSIVRKALRQGLKITQRFERAEAPVRKGKLRKSIQIYSPKGAPGTIRLALRPKATSEKGFPYPVVVIAGRGRKFLGKGRRRTLNPAKRGGNDFPTRAFEATKEQVVATATAQIETGIAAAWEK